MFTPEQLAKINAAFKRVWNNIGAEVEEVGYISQDDKLDLCLCENLSMYNEGEVQTLLKETAEKHTFSAMFKYLMANCNRL